MANRQGELTIITKAKDLVNHTLKLTNNANLFPKKVRFTLCQRMQNITLQILHDIIAANEIYPQTAAEWKRRLDLQREVLTGCKMFLTFLDISLEQGYVDIRRCEYWTGLTTDVKNLAASWRKKDVERCKQQAQGVQNGQPRGQQPYRRRFEPRGALCTCIRPGVPWSVPELVEREQRALRELGREPQQQQRVQRQQGRAPGFGGNCD